MHLRDWLNWKNMSPLDFARLTGFEPATIRTWVKGNRVPRYSAGRRIAKVTEGAVMPNDFYDLPEAVHAAE